MSLIFYSEQVAATHEIGHALKTLPAESIQKGFAEAIPGALYSDQKTFIAKIPEREIVNNAFSVGVG
ncbi:MAG: hypothetical protein HY360_24375 [Verrucomicrobia bacterium]|nr:hypothetical protein [Verrucomicrobiota bacterium]